MSADAREWLSFASADLRAAQLLLTDAAVPSRIACFHAHQAAEKAIKAVLIAESTPFRKTHDIVILVGLAPAQLATNLAAVDILVVQPWAVEGRYPGDLPDATPTEAAEVVTTAATILAVVGDWLNTAS